MKTSEIQKIRSFNRTVTEGIGLLTDRFLDRARPLGEARILWEIGSGGVEIRALRARLGLDSGYVSRVLSSLVRQRLVRIRASRDDARVRLAELTAAGRSERAELDRRSDAVAARILEPLSAAQRTTLLSAVSDVERLLQPSMVRFDVEDAATPDARWCIEQYFGELARRFEGGFDRTKAISAEPHELTPPAGALIVARLRDQPIGCGGIKLHGVAPAELKRMWIAPTARGLGLGRRLLDALEQYARSAGVKVLRLETNRALTEAIALYRRSGYRQVERFNNEPHADYWFEKRLRPRRQTPVSAAS